MILYYSEKINDNKNLFTIEELRKIIEERYKIYNIGKNLNFNKIKKILAGFGIDDILELPVIEEKPSEIHEKVGVTIDFVDKVVRTNWRKSKELQDKRMSLLREFRNKKLAETDFINFVEVENKSQVEAYRQILRDITEIAKDYDDPMEVITHIIECPHIKVIKNQSEEMNEEEYNDYLNKGSPQFIQSWAKLKFTRNKQIVKNLYEATNIV